MFGQLAEQTNHINLQMLETTWFEDIAFPDPSLRKSGTPSGHGWACACV